MNSAADRPSQTCWDDESELESDDSTILSTWMNDQDCDRSRSLIHDMRGSIGVVLLHLASLRKHPSCQDAGVQASLDVIHEMVREVTAGIERIRLEMRWMRTRFNQFRIDTLDATIHGDTSRRPIK